MPSTTTTTTTTTSECDILIIGAGPAGLMLAASLSRIDPQLKVRIVDKAEDKVQLGHADGFQVRTVEVFKSLGIAHLVTEEGNEVTEVVFYNPDPQNPKQGLVETSRMYDTPPGTSYYRHLLLAQGRVEQLLMDCAEEASGLKVERNTIPTAYTKSTDSTASHPITVTLSRLAPTKPPSEADLKSGLYRSNMFAPSEAPTAPTDGQGRDANVVATEDVKCRYLVGCDGARSWVRKELGLKLEGDSANTYWGVVDAKALTDLPTVRLKNLVHSAEAGSILTVPRERGYTRFYVQMGTLAPGERVDRSEVTVEKIIERASKILAPYKLECPEVEWYTCYEIGQRLCDTFSVDERVFIAGDACHTHSPKAGQGMNISMMDTFNLSWKLATVLQGRATPELLKTYQNERHAVAHDLITFDHKFSRLFSGKPKSAEEEGISVQEFEQVFEKSMLWASGTGVTYKPSMITLDPSKCKVDLAKNLTLGTRFPNHQVVCCGDAHPVQLQHMLQTDGRWRLILFPGDIRKSKSLKDLEDLAATLSSPKGPILRFTPEGKDVDNVIQVLTVAATPRLQIKVPNLPGILHPEQSPYGIRAWDTIFADDETYHLGHGHAYRGYGVDPNAEVGCMVLCRPDQYVAAILPITDVDTLNSYLEGVLIPQRK